MKLSASVHSVGCLAGVMGGLEASEISMMVWGREARPDGMVVVIRGADSLAGRAVTAIEFSRSSANHGSLPLSRSGINDLDQVTFKNTLDDDQYQLHFPRLPGIPDQLQHRASSMSGDWFSLLGAAFTSAQFFYPSWQTECSNTTRSPEMPHFILCQSDAKGRPNAG